MLNNACIIFYNDFCSGLVYTDLENLFNYIVERLVLYKVHRYAFIRHHPLSVFTRTCAMLYMCTKIEANVGLELAYNQNAHVQSCTTPGNIDGVPMCTRQCLHKAQIDAQNTKNDTKQNEEKRFRMHGR